MESIVDFLAQRDLTPEQFERAYPHPFLLMVKTPETMERKAVAFRTELAMDTKQLEQIARLAELRRQGKILRADADSSLFRLCKRAESPFAKHVSIGRTSQCDLVIPDGRVSKLHAYFEQEADGTYVIVDCDSSNGTKVNGAALTARRKVVVADGARIDFGPFPFRLMSARQFLAFLQNVVEDAPPQKLSVAAG